MLDFVLSELPCRVFESYSEPGAELRQFRSVNKITSLPEFGKIMVNAPSVLLSLWVDGTSDPVKIEKMDLKSEKTGKRSFRNRISDWELIQLQLGGISLQGILHSHTNHNSLARAQKWVDTYPELGQPENWNWPLVESTSRRLNSHIRKNLAVSKIGSRPVLDGATRMIERGAQALLTTASIDTMTRQDGALPVCQANN